MTLFLLTAGLGTRMRPYTESRAKPALPFLGCPLIWHTLNLFSDLDITNVICNTHYRKQDIESAINNSPFNYPVHFSHEEQILGSAGCYKKAASHIQSEHFIACNGDEVIWGLNKEQLKSWIESSKETLLNALVMPHPEAGKKFGGVWVDDENTILGFGKDPIEGAKPMHYIGGLVLDKRIIDSIPDGEPNIFYDVGVDLIRRGEKLKVTEVNPTWHETGNIADFNLAAQDLLSIIKNNPSVWIDENLEYILPGFEVHEFDNGLVIKPKTFEIPKGTKLSGFLALGNDVTLGSDCHFTNVTIESGAKVDSGTYKNTILFS